jgi:hypothetical protein
MINSVEEILGKIERAQTHEDLEGWIWIAGKFIASGPQIVVSIITPRK